VHILEQFIECDVEMRNRRGHTTTGYEPVRMQAREIKAEVEITKQECKVKAVCNICGDVSELGTKIRR
jgi:hypothetical protein